MTVDRRQFLRLTSAGSVTVPNVVWAGQDSSRVGKSRIRTVEPILIRGARNYHAWTLVRIRTDDGLVGIGEGFSFGWDNIERPHKIHSYMKQLGKRLVNKNPLQIQAFVESARSTDRVTDKLWWAAVAGIEIALWDIAGKTTGQPIYAMLGGTLRKTIPLYANHGVFFNNDTEWPFDIRRIAGVKEAGFPLFKWDPFTSPPGNPGSDVIHRDVRQVAQVRQLVGDEYPLGIDAHSRYDLDAALVAARALEPHRVEFFEEPVHMDNAKWYPRIAEVATMPLAAGESYATRKQAYPLLTSGTIGAFQPEIGANGGILETVKIASLCDTLGLRVLPHNWCSPITALATAHAVAGINNLWNMEYAGSSPAPDCQWEHELIDPPLMIRNGQLSLPTGPGLGFQLNEALVRTRRIS